MTRPNLRASLLLAWLLPTVALATPPIHEGGALDSLRLDYEPKTKLELSQGALKFAEPLKLIASFAIPPVPKGVKVQLLLSPLDAQLTIDAQQGAPYKGDDSSVEPGSWVIEMDLSLLQPQTRVLVPLTLIPHGPRGSGLKAKLLGTGEISTSGFAARIFAITANGQTRATSFQQLAREQHESLTKDVSEQRRVLLANEVLPFDEKRFEKALEVESEKIEGLQEDAP